MRRSILAIIALLASPLAWGQTGIPPFSSGGLASTSYPLNSSGNLLSTYLGTPTFYWSFNQTVGATVTANSGQTMTRVGSPIRVSDWTWPSGLGGTNGYGYKNDYWTSTIRPPTGSFSVFAVVTPSALSSGQRFFTWMAAGDTRGGFLNINAPSEFTVAVYRDGTSTPSTIVGIANAAGIGRTSIIGASYDASGGDGHCILTLFIDSLTAASTNTAVGPMFQGAGNITIGASGNGGSQYYGIIHDVAYWSGPVMTATQFAFMRDTYRGRMSNKGTAPIITWSAPGSQQLAPPSSGIEPFMIDAPANGSMVGAVYTGSGGLSKGRAVTNLLYRSRICATPDGSNHPTGWTVVETVGGGGTSDVSCNTTTSVDGASSVKIAMTVTSIGTVTSNCITSGIAADLYASIWAKETSGTPGVTLSIIEYDASDCTTALASNTLATVSGSTWTRYGAKLAAATWNASTSSWKLQIANAAAGTVYFDVPMAHVGSADLSISCTSDADAVTACTANYGTITNPLTTGNWTVKGVQRLTMAVPGVDRYVFSVPGTSGSNNAIGLYFAASTNDKIFYVYDSAGALRTSTISDAITANTDYAWTVWHRMTGEIGFSFGEWTGTVAGAGTGILATPSTTFNLGHATGDGAGWLRDLKFYKRVKP